MNLIQIKIDLSDFPNKKQNSYGLYKSDSTVEFNIRQFLIQNRITLNLDATIRQSCMYTLVIPSVNEICERDCLRLQEQLARCEAIKEGLRIPSEIAERQQ